MLIKILLISVLIGLCTSSIISKATEETGELLYRLPSNVKPSAYDLKLKIDLIDSKFNGVVVIDIEINEPTKLIGINYKDINVDWNLVVLKNKNVLGGYTFEIVELQPEYEIAYIHFVEILPVGLYSLDLQFSGDIRNDRKGLYKSTYNTNKVIATTHFEPSYARMAFPCFDEPHFKAVFKITIVHAEGLKAISNMRGLTYTGPVFEEGNVFYTEFAPTPLMSTYLVAFIVSDYEKYGGNTDPYVGYAPPGQENYTKDSVDFAPDVMKKLETFLGVEYQLTLTQLASINDFLFGAMENWGLVTFKSEYLLYPNSYVSPKIHQHSRLLISHEFAHMWFGNEVTPEWWTHVWLSEGFAQFFQYYTTHELIPKWKIWEQFNVNNLQSALSQDDKNNIRKMSAAIINPSDTQFDYIVYAKSSSIIRMFYEIIGKTVFKAALKAYLTEYSEKNVVPKNLFDSFQKEIDVAGVELPQTFTILFESWSNELGYPVVNADVQTSTNKIVVSQKRFYVDPDLMKTSLKGNYYIPITVVTKKDQDSKAVHWLKPDENNLSIDFDKDAEPVLLNKQQAGYYRVNYNSEYWTYLADFLSEEANLNLISEENRAQLIDDAANLAKAGLINYEIVFKLLHNLKHDSGFLPWMAANNAINFLARMLEGSTAYGRFENFLRLVPDKNYETYKLNVNLNEHVDRLNRVNSAAWACQYGHTKCVEEVVNIVNVYVSDSNAKFADEIRPIVFCTLSRYTEINDILAQKLIEKILGSFTSVDQLVQSEMNEIITGLGCTRNVTAIDSLIDFSTQNLVVTIPANIRARLAVSLVNGSYAGVKLVLQYMTSYFNKLLSAYDADGIESIINALGQRIVTDDVAQSFASFISTHETQLKTVQSMHDAAIKAQAAAALNVKWRKAYGSGIESWLESNIDDLDTDGSSIIVLSRSLLFIVIAAILRRFIM